MIKVENIHTYNHARAIYSARNAMNSWAKSDSDLLNNIVGENDLKLMQKLYNAGPEHAKYLRQIFVSMDVVAPLFWWREADTYKVGVTRNSCSTMHKLMEKEFTLEDFSFECFLKDSYLASDPIVELNLLRSAYLNYDERKQADPDYYNPAYSKKDFWRQVVALLPSGYNQRATLTMNYANVMNIINQRENHKLDEWHTFCDVLRGLPYVKAIRGEE